MMLQNLLKKPTQTFNVIDIVQFGSSTKKGREPNDIDVFVYFNLSVPLKEQLEISQKIKRELQQQTSIPIHIKSVTYETLFDPANFAKNAMLIGWSLLSNDFFAKRFSLIPALDIYYDLTNLDKKGKVRFNYFLNGKAHKGGILPRVEGKLQKPGFIRINPLFEEYVLSQFEKGIVYNTELVFQLV